MPLAADQRDRPSRHGVILGAVLARLAEEGAKAEPEMLEAMCATCAFRPGCMTNQMAGTGMTALKCTIGADPDGFACHHGMKDGEPTKLCAGYYLAKLASWDFTKAAVCGLSEQLAHDGPDPIREAFDAWIAEVDHENRLDDYQRGRLFLKSPLAGSSAALASAYDGQPSPRHNP